MISWRTSSQNPEASDCVEVSHGIGIRDGEASATCLRVSEGVVSVPDACERVNNRVRPAAKLL
jgi:hypothetical protein